VLGAIEKLGDSKAAIVNFLYAMQVLPDQDGKVDRCGFRGGTYVGVPFSCLQNVDHSEWPCDEGHIAMTYCALCCLLILGDDLSRVNKQAIIGGLRKLQMPNGSFCPSILGGESDVRFVFCACAISTILGDWNGFDVKAAAEYVVASQSYDGAIGIGPEAEGHGGTTYCGVAALSLMGRLDMLRDLGGLTRWCVMSQGAGFRGRPEKPEDTCYSFWTGATMSMLGVYDFTNRDGNRAFNLSCQTERGGYGKQPEYPPDLLHSSYGLCGLSFIGKEPLQPLEPRLGITQRAASPLKLAPLPIVRVPDA